jgi:phage protein U
MLLTLGDFSLDALSVLALGDQQAWKWAEHATIEDLPALQQMAPEPRRPRLEVRVHRDLGVPSETIALLREAATRGDVMALAWGTGEFVGHFVVTGLDVRRTWTLPDGTLLQATVAIELLEHRPVETDATPRAATAGTATPERTEPDAVDTDRDPDDVPLSEIVRA